jgi:hypothetical protein
MNTLRQAVQDYLNLRRSLGFKRYPGVGSRVGPTTIECPTRALGATIGFCARFCTPSQRD